ncbi:hypothetical protein FNV43_RR17063 [Rhamnella rubrinervis]|uniref:Retrotransposon gag domain-containing protein n=1 Tax=Rhamnella rubrinervis TaxID=2594499 RepID=A0A8K0GZX8_9ROSA|nr:hypothetical protein FNV43_RR17063 [Rhamnella rubrinervis]
MDLEMSYARVSNKDYWDSDDDEDPKTLSHYRSDSSNMAAQNRVQHDGITSVVEHFLRLHPPPFEGSPNPLHAEAWMRKIEKIFMVMMCSETQKATCVMLMLRKGASHWWDLTKRTYETAENAVE